MTAGLYLTQLYWCSFGTTWPASTAELSMIIELFVETANSVSYFVSVHKKIIMQP